MADLRKQIVISGGMGGIGRAAAKALAEVGHIIHILDYEINKEASTFLESIKGEGHMAHQCDLTDSDAVSKVIGEIDTPINVVIHGAVSPLIRKRISQITPTEFKEQFEVTTFGGLHLFQAVLPKMKAQKSGLLIGITTAALEPESGAATMTGYVCAKHALRGMMKELKNDVSVNGINVLELAPGFVNTDLHGDLPQEAREMLAGGDKKETSPEGVAEILVRMCAKENEEVTGKIFYADGSMKDM